MPPPIVRRSVGFASPAFAGVVITEAARTSCAIRSRENPNCSRTAWRDSTFPLPEKRRGNTFTIATAITTNTPT